MDEKKFRMIDDFFICENCGFEVKPLGYTARDHCPNCLCSKHVDINPGDRKETCHGILRPRAIEKSKKAGYKIIYECDRCHKVRKNIMASDDNMDKIIEVSNMDSGGLL